jgi:hypothetical protein
VQPSGIDETCNLDILQNKVQNIQKHDDRIYFVDSVG